NYRLVKNMLKNNKVCDFLKNYGYKTVAFYSGFSPTVINTEISICPMPISEFQWAIITTTPLRDTGYKNLLSLESLHRYRILYTFEHMSDTTKITSPHFVFVHIVSPHPPFIFREKGEKVDKPAMLFFDGKEYMDYTHTTLEEYKENYKSQIIFITGKVIKTIDDILTKSPKPPIIIIQSDHGSGAMFDHVDLKNTYLKERFSIFNAYYFPDNNYKGLYSNITPVNTFRIIFNTYFDANYKLLKDKNYYSPGSDLLNFTEVTDKIE
ncbi:MAG TPA: hypothetical protein PL110_19335, partial [Candidatus Eremiobacteraeota bacterium]|nr:hypothetical protein [Candidatus Eremiobacteraeota bacterium]